MVCIDIVKIKNNAFSVRYTSFLDGGLKAFQIK